MDETVATIISRARYWADPDPYTVSGEDLITIFEEAPCKSKPKLKDANYSVANLSTGCRIGSETKQWCGIFATMVWRYAGLDVWWDLNGGGLTIKDKSQAEYLPAPGNFDKISAGDVAIIKRANHHFLVVDNMWDWGGEPLLITIEGNTTGQKIKSNTRPLRASVLNERIYGFYHLKG
jgi:hypothetical protein